MMSLLRVFVALVLALVQRTAPAQRVQVGTSVQPETTSVGQHFVVTIRVRAPVGSVLQFPARPDSAAQVDSAGAVTRSDTTAPGYTESTVHYVLAAWDTGAQRIGVDSVSVVSAGNLRVASLGDLRVYVRSVLPRDTSLRTPRPFRPVLAVAAFNWIPWVVALAVAALLGLLLLLWRGWRRRMALGLTPLQVAQRDFARIDALGLVESGEYERYALEMAAVVRVYLASAVPLATRAATTSELVALLRRAPVVPGERLIGVLDATDMIKFARGRSSADRAVEIGAESRRIVAETNAALVAEAAAAKAAQAAKAA